MPTFLAYRRSLQAALDDGDIYTLSSSTTTTAVSTQLVNATSGASTEEYNGAHIYVATGSNPGQQRRVRTGGYAPSTGTLTVYPDWISPGVSEIEITRLFPASTPPGEDTSYRHLVNSALGMLVMPGRIDIVTVQNQTEYDLSAHAVWLDRPERVVELYDPRRRGNQPYPVSRMRRGEASGWDVIFDDGTPTLVLRNQGFAIGGHRFQLAVMRPAVYWINGNTSTTGLVADTDTALPSVEDVREVALMHAYQSLASRQAGRPSDPQILGKWKTQREIARSIRWYDTSLERPMPQPVAA